jgi:hypothetical protein
VSVVGSVCSSSHGDALMHWWKRKANNVGGRGTNTIFPYILGRKETILAKKIGL